MSGREWKPGDVALLDCGTESERVGLRDVRNEGWRTPHGYMSDEATARDAVIRPLVVIDPEDREQCRDLADRIAPNMSGNTNATQAALREIARPKPSAPTGLGAVVEDANGCQWVRVWNRHVGGKVWTQGLEIEGQQITRDYADIAAVRVLSVGVTP